MKAYILYISIILCFSINISAQTNNKSTTPRMLMEQAQKSLNEEKFTEARYFFKKAYEGFAAQDDYQPAIECGLKANSLFIREFLYKEAFELFWAMDALVRNGEEKQHAKMYDLRFILSKERLQVYMKIKNTERAREQLSILDEIGNLAKNDSISEDILYTKAHYYYTFGPAEQGVNCYLQLINKYEKQGNLHKVSECYKRMVALAEKVNNASLAVSTYKQYITWNDSVNAITAANELTEMTQKYENSQSILKEKEDQLSTKQYIIIALCLLSVILIAALIVLAAVLIRYIWLTKKQQQSIRIANEHNQLKSRFIQNISAQMDPALNTLIQTTGELSGKKDQTELIRIQIEAMRAFTKDIQELSNLENSLDEPYELQSCYLNTFCEDIVRKIKPFVQSNVEIQVNAFKLQAKMNPEQVERVLMHLLKNAALYTSTGKITLDVKKKGAHVHQFIVTDTGTGISEQLQENLFKPFTEIKDLTQGNGLGLPICSLIATKMNGSLTLDTSYTKGCRFVLELRT